MHYSWTADGSTVLFKIGKGDYPVLENSYTLKVGGSVQTEGTDYSIDVNNGLITFSSAPSDGSAITLDFKAVELTNDTWINIINYVIDDMEGPYWREGDDPDFGDTVDNQTSYDGPTNCIDVVHFYFKSVDNASVSWRPVQEHTNWRYSNDENKLYISEAFISGYPLRVSFLKGYARGDEVGDTLDMQDRYISVLQLGCVWRYYDHLLGKRVKVDTMAADEDEITPLSSLREQSRHYRSMYETQRSKKKPTKPGRRMNPTNVGQPQP